MVGLEELDSLVLHTILSRVGARGACVVACVSTRLRAGAYSDALWRLFLDQDFGVGQPLDPDGNQCPSFLVAYRIWTASFHMYPIPLVKRAKQCWEAIKDWLGTNLPEAKHTLRKGASEDDIKRAEDLLEVKFPMTMKILYRLCDGQQTFTHMFDNDRVALLGIIGGYVYYDRVVNVHLLPLSRIVEETQEFSVHFGSSMRFHYAIVALSYYSEKLFFLNCSNGELSVGTANVFSHGEVMPCVPRSFFSSTQEVDNGMTHDALLLWLEEHIRRLQSGMIQTRLLDKSPSISLFPGASPFCSVAVTNGVQVRASSIFVPELSNLLRGNERYSYAYSIRLSLLPEGCMLDGTHYQSCQLYSRHWIIKSKDVVVSDVRGEAVIGKFPLLKPGEEEFVYESCTTVPSTTGSMEGSFTFVPGRLGKPEGRQFDVKVPLLELKAPDYVF